jgi:hypothetical protein
MALQKTKLFVEYCLLLVRLCPFSFIICSKWAVCGVKAENSDILSKNAPWFHLIHYRSFKRVRVNQHIRFPLNIFRFLPPPPPAGSTHWSLVGSRKQKTFSGKRIRWFTRTLLQNGQNKWQILLKPWTVFYGQKQIVTQIYDVTSFFIRNSKYEQPR